MLVPTATPSPEPTAEATETPEPTPTATQDPEGTSPAATQAPEGTPTPKPPITPIPLQTPVPGNLDPRFGVSEGFRDAAVMADIGAGWERVVLSWADIQPDGPDDWSWLGRTLPPRAVAGELNRGVHLAGLLQFTPTWAATDLDDPGRSVPQNLDLPDDDPENYWGRFVYETVRYYTGRIDEWIVWNEPEFHPNDAAGKGSYTWLGTDAEFARLMEVAYRAAKRANPKATVAFPGTSYWIDRNSGRLQFYERFLRLEASNPDGKPGQWNHEIAMLQAAVGDAAGALTWVEKIEPPNERADALLGMSIGLAYRERGDQDRAIDHLDRAIAEMRRFNYPRLVAWYEGWLSGAHLRRGDIDRARLVPRIEWRKT